MKTIWIITSVLLALLISNLSMAAVNSPIQRIDVVNSLWNGTGVLTQTAVIISFNNGGAEPCFTTTLAYQASATLWAGAGQACTTAVTSATITPVNSIFDGLYQIPASTLINSNRYLTQMIINQNTAPVFSTNDGSITTAGTVQVSLLSNLLTH